MIGSVYFIGMTATVLFVPYLGDRFGRKKILAYLLIATTIA
jgi:MFS family permease